MSKKLFFTVLVLIFILAISLVGCDMFGDNGEDTPDIPEEDLSWNTIDSPSPTDVYNKLLSGFMSVATDFSIKSLGSSPYISADAKFKISMGDLELWAAFKGNYNNNDKANAMFSFELSTAEDSYDDVVAAIYLYKEEMFVTLGSTKFKFDMKLDKWDDIFPFDMALDNSKDINNLASFMYIVLAIEDNLIIGKTRLNGVVEEYNYVFSLDLAGSLSKIQTYLSGTTSTADTEMINKINKIFANVLGLSIEDIKAGNVPDAQLDIDFSTADNKISDLNLSIFVDQSGAYANSLFAGEDIDIKLDLVKLATTKSAITIDFVNSTTKQNQFVDYLSGEYTFKLAIDIDKVTNLETGATKQYQMVTSAKIFQDDSTNNYLLLEYYDSSTNTLEKAVYIYGNQLYAFDTIDSQLICTAKMAVDLSDTANKIYSNTLAGTEASSFSLFDTFSYILGAIKFDKDNLMFNVTDKLFTEVWYNYSQLLTYLDSLAVENIFENENVINIESFITDYNCIATFTFDKEFLTMIDSTDANLTQAIERMANCTPLVIFTPVTPAE